MIRRICKYIILITLALSFEASAQSVKSVVPDTGHQGLTFPITVNGSATEWTVSPYVEIFFDSTGVYASNAVIINDSTLTANIIIDGKASTGFHKCIVADQFLNLYTKDSAFYVFLSVPPAPVLFEPPNNSQNVNQNTYLLWDSNRYAVSFRIQIANDSVFSSVVFDSSVANTPHTLWLGLLTLGQKYYWRVSAANSLGTSPWSAVYNFRVRTTNIFVYSTNIPDRYKLFENYPNPFNSSTTIKYSVLKNERVRIIIYNTQGKEIARPVDAYHQPGTYGLRWNSSGLPSGIYFYRLQTENFTETKRLAVIK